MRDVRRARRALVGAALVALLGLSGCGIGRPEPAITRAGGGNKVLLVGDELLTRAAPKIAPTLSVSGASAQIVDLTTPGKGLLDAGLLDSLRAQFDANADASTVVIEFMGHCTTCPGGYAGGQVPQWLAAAGQLVDEIRNRGMTPVWVVAPPLAPASPIAGPVQSLATAGRSFAQARGLIVADWNEAFTDAAGYYQAALQYARWFEPVAVHVVRSDGVGFTDDGAARAATWVAAAIRAAWRVPVILDVDMFLDVDDAGGLAVAFALQRLGEAKVLALGIDLRSDHVEIAATSWQCAEAFATYYTGTTVPIGIAPPNGVSATGNDYTAPCATLGPPGLPTPPAAVEVYRQALASQPDGSVVMIGTGYQGNLAARLASGPDANSPLTGSQLVARKVRQLVVMGGGFPTSKGEHNLEGDPVAAQTVAATWPTKIVWSGSEVGIGVVTGGAITATHPVSSPLRVSYETYLGPSRAWWSWDLTTVYHAIRPGDPALEEVGPGINRVDETGGNTFTPGAGRQYYLRLTDGVALAASIDRLLSIVP